MTKLTKTCNGVEVPLSEKETEEILAHWKKSDEEAEKLRTDYSLNRQKEMPSIPDQLDAIWHAMDKGILPKVTDFYDPILKVKNLYPKTILENK